MRQFGTTDWGDNIVFQPLWEQFPVNPINRLGGWFNRIYIEQNRYQWGDIYND